MQQLGNSERAHQGPSVEREAVEMGQSVAELTAAEVLDERSWLIVQLRVQHGYTVQQVADQLGISRQRVGQIYNEAIERLREELG
jgi:RNA polymerase sigma factor (sigma-70 family)